MNDDKFNLLKKKEIYEFLEGNGPTLVTFAGEKYGMPYCTASQLSELCTDFGITDTVGGSRWCYVEALLTNAIERKRCDELFRLIFSEKRFDNLQNIPSMNDIEAVHKEIVLHAIQYINQSIRLSRHELVLADGHFYMVETGKAPVIETPKLNVRSIPYVQGLRERCNDDLMAGNYDSVITKSRTMIEEILVQILEENKSSEIAKGDLNKLYNQVKVLYGMQQSKDFDGRVNSLLSGLEKIVQAVAEMRNANSDAHGVGSRRIVIRENEARLVMNSAITFCEYMISGHGKCK